MVALVLFLVIIFPWTILSVYLFERLILPGQVVSAVIAVLGVAFFVLGRYRLSRKRDRWIVPFLFFLLVGCISTLLSPFLGEIVGKGAIQIVGILIALSYCIVIIREIERAPSLFLKIVRCLSISLGVLGWIGIAQFLVFNTVGTGFLFDFTFMNGIVNYPVWRHPGEIGGLIRANSVAQEPAHLARYLSIAAGIALIRFGLLGGRPKELITPTMPLWAAIGIIGGTIATVSLLAYIGLIVVAGACWVLSHELRGRMLKGITMSVTVALGVIAVFISSTGDEFLQKAGTVTLVATAGLGLDTPSEGVETSQISALAVASNVSVLVTSLPDHPILGVGLGGHPAAYERHAPAYARLSDELEGLNAQDAASLLVRLLSETGAAGTFLFLVGGFGLMMRCRKEILGALSRRWGADAVANYYLSMTMQCTAVAIGIAAGWAGVFAHYLVRAGQYYEQAMWISIALTAVAPYLIGNAEWPRKRS